jgi:hypothetical protein
VDISDCSVIISGIGFPYSQKYIGLFKRNDWPYCLPLMAIANFVGTFLSEVLNGHSLFYRWLNSLYEQISTITTKCHSGTSGFSFTVVRHGLPHQKLPHFKIERRVRARTHYMENTLWLTVKNNIHYYWQYHAW